MSTQRQITDTFETVLSPRKRPIRAQISGAAASGAPLASVLVRFMIGDASAGTFLLPVANGPVEIIIPEQATMQAATTIAGLTGEITVAFFPEVSQ